MILKPSRILLSESELFNIINDKKKLDVSFLANPLTLKQLEEPMADIKLRRFPALRQILAALTDKQLIPCTSENKSSGIIYSPVMDKTNKKIIAVMINLSKFSRKSTVVDSITGDTKEVIIINYEILYNLLLGGIAVLNSDKCYMNGNLIKYIRTIYTDIMVNIFTRSFGNAIYGDKLRFIIEFFFHNGEVSAKDLATATKFDENKAAVLLSKYPEYFESKDIKVSNLLDIVSDEFSNMKDVNMDTFIAGAVTMLGDSAFYAIDNQAYWLGVVMIKCRKDKDIFTGHVLKNVEVNKGVIGSLILQSL